MFYALFQNGNIEINQKTGTQIANLQIVYQLRCMHGSEPADGFDFDDRSFFYDEIGDIISDIVPLVLDAGSGEYQGFMNCMGKPCTWDAAADTTARRFQA